MVQLQKSQNDFCPYAARGFHVKFLLRRIIRTTDIYEKSIIRFACVGLPHARLNIIQIQEVHYCEMNTSRLFYKLSPASSGTNEPPDLRQFA